MFDNLVQRTNFIGDRTPGPKGFKYEATIVDCLEITSVGGSNGPDRVEE